MSSEEWKIILEEGTAGGGAPGGVASGSAESRVQKEANETIKQSAPHWASVGKFAGGLLGVVGVLSFVIQMIRRSRIFTTFMDNFLLVFSAFIDVMMIPLIPIFGAALRWIVKLFPIVFEVQKAISNFLKDPWTGIKNLFAKIPDLLTWLGDRLGKLFEGFGASNLGGLIKSIFDKLGGAFKEIVPIFNSWVDDMQRIWGDKNLTFWDKIMQTAKVTWDDIAKAGVILWSAIKDIWVNDILPFIQKIWNNFYMNTLVKTWNQFYTENLKPKWEEFMKIAKDTFSSVIASTFGKIPALFSIVVLQPMKTALLNLLGFKVTPLTEYAKNILGGGQFGIAHVPQTGMYMLHRGEEVVPSTARNTYNQNRSVNVSNIFNISTETSLLARKLAGDLHSEIRNSYLKLW